MFSNVFVFVLVFEKCSHRDGFPLHEEHPCPADNLLHLVEDAGKEGDRGEPVSSQPIMEEPENACFWNSSRKLHRGWHQLVTLNISDR